MPPKRALSRLPSLLRSSTAGPHSRSLADSPARDAPQRASAVLDEHGEGIERLRQFRPRVTSWHPLSLSRELADTSPSGWERYFSKEAKMLTNDRRFARNAQYSLDGEKFCSACRKWHPVADFPRSSTQSSGLSSWCKEAHRDAVRNWRARNRERENARRREAYRRRHARVEPCSD